MPDKKMNHDEYEKLVNELTEKVLKMWRAELRRERDKRVTKPKLK